MEGEISYYLSFNRLILEPGLRELLLKLDIS